MNSLILIFFVLYSLIILFIDNLYIIFSFLLFEIIISILLKIKCNLKSTLYFICFIFLFNLFLINFNSAILISIRLFTMILIVNIVIKKIGVINIASTFAKIFHSKELYIIISIAITFIPIMKEEILNIKKSLLIKGYQLNLINIIKKPHVLVITFFRNLFLRVSELEKTLIAAGFS